MKKLLDGVTADTDGSQDTYTISTQLLSQDINVVAYGTFDGCTVTLEFSPDGGTTWIEVGSDTTFTTNGSGIFTLPNGILVRGSVTSSGASTDVTLGIL